MTNLNNNNKKSQAIRTTAIFQWKFNSVTASSQNESMKKILISLFLVTSLLLVLIEAHRKNNRGYGFRSGRQESSLEEKTSDVESCDDFCARRERERQREQDDKRACEQQRGKHKCKSSSRRILGIPGLLPSPGVVELHKRVFPLPPFLRSKRSPMAWVRKHSKNFHGDLGGSSNRQRESDCECERRMVRKFPYQTQHQIYVGLLILISQMSTTTTPSTTGEYLSCKF